jgi:K+-sensing histidine kinase KdpD
VNIHITDQGEGFSDQAINQLFEFFSSDNIMEHSEGLGLGLAAAKLVLEAHKGQISVLNSKDGVTVTLTVKKF